MRRDVLMTAAMIFAVGTLVTMSAQSNGRRYSATLEPGQETPNTLAAPGGGTITLDIDEKAGEISYELSFGGLMSDVTQAHIHFAQRAMSGGIMLWLCQTAANPSPTATTPFCPVGGGTVSGTLVSTDVRPIANQRVNAEDFAQAVAQIRAGLTYANVHTVAHGPGQIRGQITQGGSHK
jgi:hypothetical protein